MFIIVDGVPAFAEGAVERGFVLPKFGDQGEWSTYTRLPSGYAKSLFTGGVGH